MDKYMAHVANQCCEFYDSKRIQRTSTCDRVLDIGEFTMFPTEGAKNLVLVGDGDYLLKLHAIDFVDISLQNAVQRLPVPEEKVINRSLFICNITLYKCCNI